ncbi:MAG: DNA-directed RNA polymerase subunit alpha [Planctomycetia bacterium]|nr:DNA-directed RNA polymerase subunit alpha [Planctomycetia bacterium]
MRIRWRGLELPSKVTCDKDTCTPTYGKFFAEPFERGFGITVGNSIRRVLLSSLEGSAVTRMKLRGATLEYTSLDGVMEDVTEIALNVKSLIVRLHDEKPHVIRIEKSKAGPVTAGDIIPDSVVEIINTDLVIATLTADVPFYLEMVVENGRGYVPAAEQALTRDRNEEIGTIPLDASFSPVVHVKYQVQETRVVQKTNYDRLILEITTDGTVDPELALVEAAKILRKHLNPFIQYDRVEGNVFSRAKTAGTSGLDPALEAKLAMSLAELNLSVRAMNCLETENINTVRELVVRNEDSLLEVRNFGETTLNEVKEKLTAIGLRLGMRIPSPPANQGAVNPF